MNRNEVLQKIMTLPLDGAFREWVGLHLTHYTDSLESIWRQTCREGRVQFFYLLNIPEVVAIYPHWQNLLSRHTFYSDMYFHAPYSSEAESESYVKMRAASGELDDILERLEPVFRQYSLERLIELLSEVIHD